MARAGRSDVSYFWAEPDPEIQAQKLIELADSLEDLRVPLEAATFITMENTEARFKSMTDSSGRGWDEWADSYAPYALTHSTGSIRPGRANLHLTGKLHRAAVRRTSYKTTKNAVFLDARKLPPYWAWNNFGATRRVPGKEAPTKAAVMSQAKHILAQAKVEGRVMTPKQAVLQGHRELSRQNELPARQFVGLSPIAQGKITQAFAMWFDEEVDVATSVKGKKFFRRKARRGPRDAFVQGT